LASADETQRRDHENIFIANFATQSPRQRLLTTRVTRDDVDCASIIDEVNCENICGTGVSSMLTNVDAGRCCTFASAGEAVERADDGAARALHRRVNTSLSGTLFF